MKEISGVQILIGVVSLLVTVVGAFGAFLLRRLEKGNDLLTSIDKKMAVMDTKVENNIKNIDKLDTRLVNDVVSMSRRVDIIAKDNDKQDLSLFELKTELKEVNKKLSDNLKLYSQGE